jgi:CspA family cold shock protein
LRLATGRAAGQGWWTSKYGQGDQKMPTGTVKWFNATKGYGFIQPDQGGPDVFVHISAVERSGMNGLNDGDAVSFDLENDPRKGKTSAVNLKRV